MDTHLCTSDGSGLADTACGISDSSAGILLTRVVSTRASSSRSASTGAGSSFKGTEKARTRPGLAHS